MTKSLLSMVFMTAFACGRTQLPPESERASWPASMRTWDQRTHLVVTNRDRSETLVDLPILIHLDASRIDYGVMRSSGADLRFVEADGTVLSHEVERWQVGGDSFVWVRLPVLEANADHDVWMYYGNRAAESVEDARAVWRNGYLAVYHFADSRSVFAATSASNVGVTFAGAFIGAHASFDGSTAYLSVPPGFSDFAGGVSIEAWVRPSASTRYARVIDFGNGEAIDNIVFYRTGVLDELTYEVHDPGARVTVPGAIVDGAWQYFVASHAPDGVATLYKDAAPLISGSGVPLPSPVERTLNFIGRSNWVDDELYAGDMDELRVSNVPRSSAWIDAQYASMTDQLVLFDAPEPR